MLLEQLGEGFFGVVRKAYLYLNLEKPLNAQSKVGSDPSENKTVVACKMLKGTRMHIILAIAKLSCFSNFPERFLHHDEVDFLEEIKLMKRNGRHPHIVSTLACVTVSQPLFLIVEYCCHGDLLSFLLKKRADVS